MADPSPPVERRRFLAYLIAAPTLTMGVRLAVDEVSPATAAATPGLPDLFDLTDALVLAAAPTVHNLVVEITQDNKVVVQLPREEVGQGITTTFTMVVAEELDARLAELERRRDGAPADAADEERRIAAS
ncbi:MAG: hypothetical protein ACRDSN_16350 [Pseudonocardiaceae bacterium]